MTNSKQSRKEPQTGCQINLVQDKDIGCQQLLDAIDFGIFIINALTHHILYVNDTAAKMIGRRKEKIIGSLCHNYVCPSEIGKCPITDLGLSIDRSERTLIKGAGQKIPVIKTVNPIFKNGKMILVESFIDITDRRKIEDQLKYDCLTKLYNRTFFEQEMIRLGMSNQQVGIIVCDIDGLKLINDTLGHVKGDEFLDQAAAIIKQSCRDSDFVARIGGDEFVILVPEATTFQLEEMYEKIQAALALHNTENPSATLSLSIGYCLRQSGQNINSAFQEADKIMYRQKLHHGQSTRNTVLQNLTKSLESRDFMIEGHPERVKQLGVQLARKKELSDRQISEISMLGKYHDIGKVGIPDNILFKQGRLTGSERSFIQSHCEIGYRIARSTNDISPIADFILKHHEWWNGQGYPLGIRGDEIPIESRIIAIADAYDSMTSNRPYRKAMSPQEALNELQANSGKQFDPQLISLFVEMMEHNS